MRYAAGGGRLVRHEGQLQVRGQVGLRKHGGDELVRPPSMSSQELVRAWAGVADRDSIAGQPL
jgi:hypothetical protein